MIERKVKSKFRKCVKPFLGYKSKGPYTYNASGRRYIHLYRKGEVLTLSYARYLMEVKLGYRLRRDVEVDHIDGNCTNDTYGNLQSLERKLHSVKSLNDQSRLGTQNRVELICPACCKVFSRRLSKTFLKSGAKFTACSKACSATCKSLRLKNDTSHLIYSKASRTAPSNSNCVPWKLVSKVLYYTRCYSECKHCHSEFEVKQRRETYCSSACARLSQTLITDTDLLKLKRRSVRTYGRVNFSWIAKQLNVSDNAVRKRLNKL